MRIHIYICTHTFTNKQNYIISLPSVSCSLIMSRNSSIVGFIPRLFITVPSSSKVILPFLSLSKSSNAARNSV